MKWRYKGVVTSGAMLRDWVILDLKLNPDDVGEWIVKDGQFQILSRARPFRVLWHRQFTTDGLGVRNLREDGDND